MNSIKIRKIISSSISILLFTILIIMVIAVVSSKASGGEPQLLGFQLKTVLSGSMEPTFKTGSIIAIKPIENNQNAEVNDVITFKVSSGELVTHRIIEVINNGGNTMYLTKGDNNDEQDSQPVLSQNLVGVYSGITIPYAGYFINFSNSQMGTAILLILPGLILLLYSGITIWKVISKVELKVQTPKESLVEKENL